MIISEQSAEIEVPDDYTRNGPGSKMPGFYNRTQKLNRDISVLFVKSLKPAKSLDAFGGTGVRGIRLAKETGTEVTISEQNPLAYKYVTRNISLNGMKIKSHNLSFQQTCDTDIFDYIDIDPYGSVVHYADQALNSVRPGGFVGFTATDLSTLTGSVKNKTRRRYNGYIENDSFRHEMGLRLLISYIVKRAAVFDRAAIPLISLWNSHFYRLFFKVEKGVHKADRLLDSIDYINKKELLWDKYKDIEEGPVWTGKLNDTNVLQMIIDNAETINSGAVNKYLHFMRGEDRMLLFWDLTRITQERHSDMPRILNIIDRLNEKGLEAGRTEFCETGVKCACEIEDVLSVFN